MVDLDLPSLGAAYYTGNCHKWLCAPKGAAFLHVRKDKQDGIQPTAVSHGYSGKSEMGSALQRAFHCQGTIDPTAWLCVGPGIEWGRTLYAGGLEEWRQRNHEKVVEARERLCSRWGTTPPCPAEMLGSMAVVPVPPYDPNILPTPAGQWGNPLQGLLFERYRIEVPVVGWGENPHGAVRISAQAYNALEDYDRLATAVLDLLPAGRPD
jgi:isopenicillin-N epimerase